MMIALSQLRQFRLTSEQIFMGSALIVNAGNYFYNLGLGRILGPKAFADAAILITLMLVLSFIAMTFQLAVAKFITEYEPSQQAIFIKKAYKKATVCGMVLGSAIVVFAKELQLVFQTDTAAMFTIFGMAIPVYFVMSTNRGNLQGRKAFVSLSLTYQFEMICRLGLTFGLLVLFDVNSSIIVSSAIAISFIAGVFPFRKFRTKVPVKTVLTTAETKRVLQFFLLTASYELTQIICNNSDILLVKYYFPSYKAGLYASLALIGRVVYFVTWMFVMLLLPTVVKLRKQGHNAVPVLMKYLTYIGILTMVIVLFTFLCPTLSVQLLFGSDYLAIAPLLGWYALATSFFALANVFAYYFLSLDQFKPIVITAVFGILQLVLITGFHNSLFEVVLAQVIAMGGLLIAQLIYFRWSLPASKKCFIER